MSAPTARASIVPRLGSDPRVVAAAAAVLLRALVASQASSKGAEVSTLDGEHYLNWAADIARGDVLGRGGTLHGEPFLFNPLYAYVLAPLVALFGKSAAAVVVLQTLLAGATAAFAAAAAKRFSGTLAAWIAGLAVAFSAALVHLDGKVAVAGLAAFVIAGASFSLSPEEDGAPPRHGHGPLAAGVWLGLSLLARPVTLFALPFVLWLVARRDPRRLRAAALFVLPVALCAGLSLARNVAVSGEPVVFTAADGLNLQLGNNARARRLRSMESDDFGFGPLEMHDDARFRVAYDLAREPTRGEISAFFRRRAFAELAARPAESLAWYATKLRWSASPAEPSSSYSIIVDRRTVRLLDLAFVPTCALVALAAAALVRRRRDGLLLGPGSLVLGHVVACTLVYPLSHYRAPAIPAAAVMAGVVVAEIVAAWRAQAFVRAAAPLALAAGVLVVGALPPSPREYPEAQRLTDEANRALDQDDLPLADERAARALEVGGDDVVALTVRLQVANEWKRYADARAFAARIVALRPWDPHPRLDVALADVRLGDKAGAMRAADEVVALYPWSAELVGWRGEIGAVAGDPRAKDDLAYATARGFKASAAALRLVGLPPPKADGR